MGLTHLRRVAYRDCFRHDAGLDAWMGHELGGCDAQCDGLCVRRYSVLFQYHCNIIYLVGAAWLPLGMRAIDRWVRLGRRWGLFELSIVLALQMLGGDPQAAYLLGLAAGGYAFGIVWSRARRNSPPKCE